MLENLLGFSVRIPIALILFMLVATGIVTSQDLKQFDFKNYSYPWSGPPNWSGEFEWLDLSESNVVRLTDGRWADPAQDEERAKYKLPFAGLTLESVTTGDVTGQGQDDALVVIRYDTGGTQFEEFVYIYSLVEGHPRLLAYFHAGDRAYLGLYRVYAQNKQLVIELYDPSKLTGDCCSSGFIRTRYHWNTKNFEQVGEKEFGSAQTPSRLPLSPFGIHP